LVRARRNPNQAKTLPTTLPAHIIQVTWFGERADWSHDGKKILFLTKTFGDAMELDLATKRIRNLTAHYPHHGYTRALYLANGDILLSGPEQFDPKRIGEARAQCWLYILDRNLSKPAAPLGTKCSEGRRSHANECTLPGRTWRQSIRMKCPQAVHGCRKRTWCLRTANRSCEPAAHH